jgi:hypothetical protein
VIVHYSNGWQRSIAYLRVKNHRSTGTSPAVACRVRFAPI